MDTLILMGIKHCGKSTQARLISSIKQIDCFDTDDVITEMNGMTPREIYNEHGREAFLEAEVNACMNLAQKLKNKKAVIATGGGICTNEKACNILKSLGTLVFLRIDEKTATNRVLREISIDENGNLVNAPAYIAKKNPRSIEEAGLIFHDFFIEREKLYMELCDLTVDVSTLTKQENANKIIQETGF